MTPAEKRWDTPPKEKDQELVRRFLSEVLHGRYDGQMRECARATGIDHGQISRWESKGPEGVHHIKGSTWRRVKKALGEDVPPAGDEEV